MKKPLRPQTLAALFGIAVTILFWMSITAFRSTHQLVLAFDAVAQARQGLDKLQHVEVLLESADASVQGFVITGESRRLDPFRYTKLVLPYEIAQLDGLMAGSLEERKTWGRLKRVLNSHLVYLDRTITVRRWEGFRGAARWIRTHDDTSKRNAMDKLLSDALQKERAKLEELHNYSDEHSLKTKAVLVLAGTVSVSLLIWVFSLLQRESDQRLRAQLVTQRTETFLDSIVERIPYMILVREAEHMRLILVNKAAEEWLGRSREELLGSNEYDRLPREEAAAAIDKDRDVLRGGALVDIPEERLVLSGHEERFLHTQKIPVPDEEGRPAYLLTISEDITLRKQAERMLELSRDAAVESARLKSEFIRNMSHEIRTPLSVVSGMAQLLLDTSLTPEQRQFALTAQKSADNLTILSKSILDFSKIEAGTFSLDIKDIDVRHIVEDVVAMLDKQAKAKSISVVGLIYKEIPPLLQGDAVRLRQVMTQLIGNAVKFTERGEVIVRVSEARQTEEQVWLHCRISDTGVGIPEDVQPHLFEAFRQGDGSRTRKFGGIGLGLAISKRIVELMGGEIGFESSPGKGSTFWFTVPFVKSSVEGALKEPPSPPWARARILVVDENETVRQLIQQHLRSWALSTEAVSTGQTALELLRREEKGGRPFPIVILDMHLPDMDGVVFLRSLKGDPALCRTKVVVMAQADPSLEESALSTLGFSGWTPKPPKFEELHRLLASLIESDRPLNDRKVS